VPICIQSLEKVLILSKNFLKILIFNLGIKNADRTRPRDQWSRE
jgi:hypothetical protein